MTLIQALLVYGARLMGNQPYDHQVMTDVVEAIVSVTSDVQESSTLLSIARWESGGFRLDIATCVIRGDNNLALGTWQVHAFSKTEYIALCSNNFRDQAKVALFHLRDSVSVCKMHGYRGSALITIYTSGFCHKEDAVSFSHWGNGKSLQALIWTEVNQAIFKHDLGLLADATASEEANQSDERE